jgi:hypothetical protein
LRERGPRHGDYQRESSSGASDKADLHEAFPFSSGGAVSIIVLLEQEIEADARGDGRQAQQKRIEP